MPSREKLEEIRTQITSWRNEAEDGNRPTFRRMTKCERFKVGKQWDADALEWYRSHNKHPATINQVLPIINQLNGQQVENSRDLTAVAQKGGNAVRARLLSSLIKQITDSSNGQHHQAMTFDNGITTSRGYIGIDTSYLEDPFGDLKLRTYDPFSVLPDPHRKRYDPNDWQDGWRYVFIDEWEPKTKIEARYPRKKQALANVHYGASEQSAGWIGRLVSLFFPGNAPWDTHDDYRDPNQTDESSPDTSTKWEDHYRVTTCYWREWREGAYIQRVDVPDWFIVLNSEADIRYARDLLEQTGATNIRLIEKDNTGKPIVVPVLMRTTMVGDVILDHEEDPFDGIWKYPIVPYNAYFTNGYEFSVVDNLIGPQEICNWSWSMVLNIVKKIANTGWKVKGGSQQALADLESKGSKDGIIINEALYGGKVEKLEQSGYPAPFHNIMEASSIQMREIANVRTERPEFDAQNQSGVAIGRKQAASAQGAAIMFRNWDMTLEIIGTVLIEHILLRKTYTRDEIKEIVDKDDLIDPQYLQKAREMVMQAAKIPPKPPSAPDPNLLTASGPEVQALMVAQYQKLLTMYGEAMQEVEKQAPELAVEMLLDELDEIKMGKTKFAVKSSLSESASTFREMKLAQTIALNDALIKSGEFGVGRDNLVKASDVPNKEAILQAKPPQPAMAAA